MEFYSLSPKDALKELKTEKDGLSDDKAKSRLEKYGTNELKKEKGQSKLGLFLNQFKSFLIIILIIAAIIAFLISLERGEYPTDSIVIAVIVVINAIVGFVQEYKAEKSLEALEKMVSPSARVLRSGREEMVPAKEIVPGDVILLEAGDRVPADCRLIDALDLKVDEAALTGESNPVNKNIKKLKKGTSLADRKDMVYSGTVVVYGKGRAVVTTTGMRTELGKIASMVQETTAEDTPLQKRLATVGKQIGIGIILICIVVFFIGIMKVGWTQAAAIEIFLISIALAVAAIPEGLPAVVTMALALGTQRMAKRNAIIRKLPAVETLGSCDVICSDKTGTFTKNEMTVRRLYVNGKELEVTGTGYSTEGDIKLGGDEINLAAVKGLNELVRCGVLCNNASLEGEGLGDPTEISLLVLGEKVGMGKQRLEDAYPRKKEIQFDSQRKRMSTVNKSDGKQAVYMKGATEVVLEHCDKMLVDGKAVKLTKSRKEELLKKNNEMADSALRVLGLAYKAKKREKEVEKGLTFIGMAGMIDPPREEVKDAIRICNEAGVSVKMITGDHAITARAIADGIGLPKGKAVTGVELEKMGDKELEEKVEDISVFARVNPEHKLRIVKALKAKGHIVAMTGDGVNDAPALKRSDIGVAMGITGTEVTKESGGMILTDDNFSTIVSAVEEGRGIYDNIKKFVRYPMSSNLGEVLTVFLGFLLFREGAIVLLPVQILWVNLLTDSVPALALGVDPKEKDIMRRPPRPADENIFSGIMLKTILVVGAVMALITLGIYMIYLNDVNLTAKATTMAFSVLVMSQLVNAFNCRAEKKSLFEAGFLKNKWLLLAVGVTALLQIAVVHVGFLQDAFQTVALNLGDWAIVGGLSLSVFAAIEIYKVFERRRD